MARPIWSGHLTFGLVSIPVALHSALESGERVHFRMLHRKDMAPIRYKKVCSKEEVEVSNDEIVKGYEVRKGKYAVVEEEELNEVQEEVGEGDRTIEIMQFVEFASINPLLFEKPYYVAPQKGGAKAYSLLQDALLATRKVGVARFYMRTRPLLAALVPGQDLMSLEVIRMPSELRKPSEVKVENAKVRDNERKMAIALIDQMTGEWDPTEHPNTYRKALEKLIAKKQPVAVGEGARAAEGGGKVVDLMDALRRSLGDHGGRAKKAPARAARARGRSAKRKTA
ncbi:MAG TPA: Ku protein [Candidatus Binatia bacterium]|nr:Ku protein [Candidatus Binatia bacterium]